MDVKVVSNKILPWARTQKLGYYGKFDAIYSASKNKERMKYMHFPQEPIITSRWVLFENEKSKNSFKKFSSLDGKKICLIRGYNYPKEFFNYIQKHSVITTASTEELNIRKLLANRCDYMPSILATTLNLLKTNKSLKKIEAAQKIYYSTTTLAKTDFYLIFSKRTVSKKFVQRFSQTLKKFKQTKEYKKLLKKYL